MKTTSAATLLLSFALLAATAGCAMNITRGVEITPERLQAFQPEVATKDDVIAALGTPGASANTPEGGTALVYTFVHSRINPPSFATLTGAAPRTELVAVQVTVCKFDGEGKLIGCSSSTSHP